VALEQAARMTPNPHTDETINVVGRMWRAGLSSGMISKAMNLTRNQVIGIVSRQRNLEGEQLWPSRKGQRASTIPRSKKRRSAPQSDSHSAERPKPLSTTTQRPSVNPEPPRASTKPIRFFLRELSQCAFIEGEPTSEAMCCGAPVEFGYSWCAHHRRLVFPEKPQMAGKEVSLPKIGVAA